jgi:hypothetical protein
MTVLRWIAFIPLALAASVLAGAAGYWFGNFFVVRYFDLGSFGEATAWIVSGLGSGFAFIFTGMKVAPLRSNKVKWTLVVILFVLGVVSAIGGFFGDENQLVALAGVVMILAGIGAARMQPDQLVV